MQFVLIQRELVDLASIMRDKQMNFWRLLCALHLNVQGKSEARRSKMKDHRKISFTSNLSLLLLFESLSEFLSEFYSEFFL